MEHRKYCTKSNMRCAVFHVDGICPDVRDCEACKEETKQATPSTGEGRCCEKCDEWMSKGNVRPLPCSHALHTRCIQPLCKCHSPLSAREVFRKVLTPIPFEEADQHEDRIMSALTAFTLSLSKELDRKIGDWMPKRSEYEGEELKKVRDAIAFTRKEIVAIIKDTLQLKKDV